MTTITFVGTEVIHAFLDECRQKKTFNKMATSTEFGRSDVKVKLLSEEDAERFKVMFEDFCIRSEGHLDVFSEIGS